MIMDFKGDGHTLFLKFNPKESLCMKTNKILRLPLTSVDVRYLYTCRILTFRMHTYTA